MRSVRNHIYLAAAVLAFAPFTAQAEMLAGPVAARIERVVDGDTVRVRALIWIDQEIAISVRLDAVDAPELFRPRCATEYDLAVKARDFTTRFLGDQSAVLRDIHYGKYAGRVVARVESVSGDDLGTALVEAGLAVRGAARPWCEGTS